jgi:hypothetical protein
LTAGSASAQQLLFHPAKALLGDATANAQQNFAQDAKLAGILFSAGGSGPMAFSMDANTGEANIWFYIFYSPSMDSAAIAYAADVQGVGVTISLVAGPPTEGKAPSVIVGDQWMDSDAILAVIRNNGAKPFFEKHSIVDVTFAVLVNDSTSGFNLWSLVMASGADTINCAADAETGLKFNLCNLISTAVERIAALAPASLTMYPNPLAVGESGTVRVAYQAVRTETLQLEVVNSAGMSVYSASFNAVQGRNESQLIEAALFPSSGVYFVLLRSAMGLRASGLLRVLR